MTSDLKIRRLWDASDADVIVLVAQSDAYLDALYPPESNHAENLETLVGGNSAFFVGYLGEVAVACGAAKIVDDDGKYGEVKRVFVAEEERGKNLASAMMQCLESHFRKNGVKVVRLEAGPRQPAALNFYRKLGYSERGPFGVYVVDPLSVFMEKVLLE